MKSLCGVLLLSLAQIGFGQIVLNSGEVRHAISVIPIQGNCSEFFFEGGIFHAPIRQVARLRIQLGEDILGNGESIAVGMFDNFYGVGGTNVVFHGPTNRIELLCPELWTNNFGFAQILMLSGSVAITNISLTTKYISGSGCALVYQTNFSHLHLIPGPKLTVDNSYTWFFGFSYLLWPTNAVGYQLEESEALPQSPWRPVTNLIGTIDTNHFYEVYIYGGAPPQRYYRLRKAF